MGAIETMFTVTFIIIGTLAVGLMLSIGDEIGDIRDNNIQHEEDFGLGSAVTTTSEYERMANDSFTGVVVRGEGCSDPALTIRNKDGVERRMATHFLEPMR